MTIVKRPVAPPNVDGRLASAVEFRSTAMICACIAGITAMAAPPKKESSWRDDDHVAGLDTYFNPPPKGSSYERMRPRWCTE